MFTAFDLCAAADATDPLKNLFKFLDDNSKTDPEIQALTNILISHIANSERFMKPYADALSANTAVAITTSSTDSFHLIDEIGGIPVLVNSPLAARAVYTIKPIEDQELTSEIPAKPVNDQQLLSEEIDEPLKETFEFVKRRIEEEGMTQLLAKPADIRSVGAELPSVSPITSIADPLSLTSLLGGRDVSHEGSIGLLSALGLMGRRHFEAPLPKDVSGVNRLLSSQWKERARIPVLYVGDGGDFRSTRWENTSALFQQFASSLGSATKDGLSVQSNTWRVDAQFDLMPMFSEDAMTAAVDMPVLVLWSDTETPTVLMLPPRTTQVLVTPLPCGLIKVAVSVPTFIKEFGPIKGTCCIPPAAAPTLIRTTATTLYCAVSKKSQDLLQKWFQDADEYRKLEETVFSASDSL